MYRLKVKRRSLGAEIRIIRQVARQKLRTGRRRNTKQLPSDKSYAAYLSLREHARHLSIKVRHANLAHAFMRGTPYSKVEHRARTTPSAVEIAADFLLANGMTTKNLSPTDLIKLQGDIIAWIDGADTSVLVDLTTI